jgi:hypothetical protein
LVITGWLSLGGLRLLLTNGYYEYKTDITALNSIIKYSLGWALLL